MLTLISSQLVQACQLAKRLSDHRHPAHWLPRRLVDAYILADRPMERSLLLRYGTWNHRWLPSIMCV